MTLAAYLAATRHQQWATCAEVALAAQCLKINLQIKEAKSVYVVGEGMLRFRVKLHQQHFVLVKVYAKNAGNDRNPSLTRAGMRPAAWDWQHGPQGLRIAPPGLEDATSAPGTEVPIQTRPKQSWTWDHASPTPATVPHVAVRPPMLGASPLIPTRQEGPDVSHTRPPTPANPAAVQVDVHASVRSEVRDLQLSLEAATTVYDLRRRLAL